MIWLDPQHCSNDNDYVHEAIETIIQNFKVPLEAAGFDKRKVFTEWRLLRMVILSKAISNDDVGKFFHYKREEYQNILNLLPYCFE